MLRLTAHRIGASMSDRPPEDDLLGSWLGLSDVLEAKPEMRRLLFDPVTGLPTMPLLLPDIDTLMKERGEVSLLCLDVVRYSRIEEIYGWRVFDQVMRDVASALESITGRYIRTTDTVAVLMMSGNSFVIVLSPPRNTRHLDREDRIALGRRVEARVREHLAERMEPAIYRKFGCYVGTATVKQEDNVRLERLLHDGLEKALAEACARQDEDAEDRRSRLQRILDDEAVITLVHPLIDFEERRVVGYEALSRGPEGGEFEHPEKLFKVAYDADLVTRLERLCRRQALRVAESMPEDRLLFVNVEPESLIDPELRDAILGRMKDGSVAPERLVLEITERTAILDYPTFRTSVEYLRALGVGFAIDDAGAGYGSLQVLAEVRPEWVKIDMSLVRGLDADGARRSLVAGLVAFAEETGARLVAEGIETATELGALRDMGVRFGQGFLFSLPAPPFPPDPALDV